MALVMKDNAPAQILVMPQGGGQVSFAAQPASYTPGQPVVMNQEVSFHRCNLTSRGNLHNLEVSRQATIPVA